MILVTFLHYICSYFITTCVMETFLYIHNASYKFVGEKSISLASLKQIDFDLKKMILRANQLSFFVFFIILLLLLVF